MLFNTFRRFEHDWLCIAKSFMHRRLEDRRRIVTCLIYRRRPDGAEGVPEVGGLYFAVRSEVQAVVTVRGTTRGAPLLPPTGMETRNRFPSGATSYS